MRLGQRKKYKKYKKRRMVDPKIRFERFVERIPLVDCWMWAGALDRKGYGSFGDGERIRGAHQFAFLIAHGRDVLPGLEIDHKCRVRSCVRPDHLEEVTHAENLRRARDRAPQVLRAIAIDETQTCRRGHAGQYVGVRGRRQCGECKRAYKKLYTARRRAEL